MINQISKAFHQSLLNLDWMDRATLVQAQLKLSQIVRHVGRPSKYNTYAGYDVKDGFFFESMLNSMIYLFSHQIAHVGQPADRSVWEVSPLTVDAFYSMFRAQVSYLFHIGGVHFLY
jgi:putative endopeptidase